MSKKFYITTAIDYANDVIHIGHSYQKILADTLARYHRQKGDETHFLTGTDEHGQKVEKSALKNKEDPKEFVDRIAAEDKSQWDALNISYDRFIRTTDEDHVNFAKEVYLKSKAAGDIYLGKYEGLYCEGCEGYYEEVELIDGKCPFHSNRTILNVAEENYFFKLSKYQKFLEDLVENKEKFVVPDGKRKEILSFIKRGLKDFSVSRPNVKWGIPVPDDEKHTIYVWFDALLNYLTYGVEENCWPADVHVLGKDNAKFHAIYWPAMLKSAGYELPKTILVHDFISLNGQKVSKSLGNVISPSELVAKFGVDGTRYYFLRYGPLTNDVDITLEKIRDVYNADLANGLGNLVARVARLAQDKDLTVGEVTQDRPNRIREVTEPLLDQYKVNQALDYIWGIISGVDRYIEKERPWEKEAKDADNVLGEPVTSIREIAEALVPFLPETAERILIQFAGPKIKSEAPMFPRIK